MLSLEVLTHQIMEAARNERFREAIDLMHELPHDKFTSMTISSSEKKLKMLNDENLNDSEKTNLRKSIQKYILLEMGVYKSA